MDAVDVTQILRFETEPIKQEVVLSSAGNDDYMSRISGAATREGLRPEWCQQITQACNPQKQSGRGVKRPVHHHGSCLTGSSVMCFSPED